MEEQSGDGGAEEEPPRKVIRIDPSIAGLNDSDLRAAAVAAEALAHFNESHARVAQRALDSIAHAATIQHASVIESMAGITAAKMQADFGQMLKHSGFDAASTVQRALDVSGVMEQAFKSTTIGESALNALTSAAAREAQSALAAMTTIPNSVVEQAISGITMAIPDLRVLPQIDAITSAALRDFVDVDSQLSRLVADTSVLTRHALINFDGLHEVLRAARAIAPDDIDTDAILKQAANYSTAAARPPLTPDGDLTTDPGEVQNWFANLTAQVLAATKFNEKDLGEEAVAGYVYLMVLLLAFSMLLHTPLLASVAGLLGLAAHPPAKSASRISRHAYRYLNAPPDHPDDVDDEDE